MIAKVAKSAAMFDKFRHLQSINTILFNKNKFGNEYFEVDCQSSDDKGRDVWQISRLARHKHKISWKDSW